ncbi:cation diffusion facilitator family transporter [Candidatus Saccharibacteria bacterium]|nr:cation diffusion facilitator family transporter [Candidatus Saccharibacteria bacterium]
MKKSHERIAFRAGRNSIMINVLLSAFKLFAGIIGNSAAMVADAAHSMTDLLSTIIALAGIKLAGKKPDKDHPRGHQHYEGVATVILAIMIAIVGVSIGWAGMRMIISGQHQEMGVPGVLAAVAAVVSIGVKEAVYRYMRAVAKKVKSSALMADAVHSRMDGLSSVGSLAGILGARIGFPVLDSVAAVVIGLFILKAALDILKRVPRRRGRR